MIEFNQNMLWNKKVSYMYYMNRILLLCVLVSMLCVACVDPEGKYNDFEERKSNFQGPDMMMEEVPMIMQDKIPAITSGKFLFGLAPIIDLTKPMVFVADIEFTVSEDGQIGSIF